MISIENERLTKALEKLKIFIVPKNIAVYNEENQIIELYLSRFGLKEIPFDFFEDLVFEYVQKLYLNSNKLVQVPQQLFKPLKKLQYLNLSRNYLTRIEKDTFYSLPALLDIDLSNNNISEIDENSFSSSKLLTSINLKNNNLEDISENIFAQLDNLQNVNLAINKFRILPKALKILYKRNMTFLDLKGNYIPYEFSKEFTTAEVIHSFISELNEFWSNESDELNINDLDTIVKQYLFVALMSVYHYSVNVPVLNYSLLNITLGYVTKNFHLLTSYLADQKNELSFRHTLQLWNICLDYFKPIEEALAKMLNNKEIDNERQRRILERRQKLLSELEREVLEYGGVMDYKFKKADLEELELEPVHENLFNLIKKFLSWNTQKYSTVFL